MARHVGKILMDPEIGEVVFRKSLRSRSISIRVHPVKGVSVSVPYIVPYAAARLFFEARREWILETMARQKERLKDVRPAAPGEIEALRRQAKAELPPRLAGLAARYGFIYNKVTIKHNASNWGSCSSKGNINLNLNIVRLPKVLQDYILLHELCHLRHQDHGHAFHLLLEHVLTDNLMHLLDSAASVPPSDHAIASDLARKAAASKARYPLDYTMTRAIKQYRVI
ncbi:MAG: M48 family metallopeptidase [Bacteroidales bacterium]|nr:M48 family metallopeptidase [Bacteroidales bacterium]